MIENRNGLVVGAEASQSATNAEREVSLNLLNQVVVPAQQRKADQQVTVGADTQSQDGKFIEALRQIEASEEHLLQLGFRQVRVRHHGELARVEIERGELAKALSLEMLQSIAAGVRAAGFTYVTLDADGYRSGSMNALLPVESLLPQPVVPHGS